MPLTLDEKIKEYYQELVYSLTKTIKEKNYSIANPSGVRVNEPYDVVDLGIFGIGILEKRKPVLWIKRRALHIGKLRLEYAYKPRDSWTLEVYGEKKIPQMTELGKEISNKYSVKVIVSLRRQKPSFEKYLSDAYFGKG